MGSNAGIIGLLPESILHKYITSMKWLYIIFIVPLLLIAGTLLLNRAPLLQTPGPLLRCKLYLTTHVAETRFDHERPELQPLLLDVPEAKAPGVVIEAMQQLHWHQIAADQSTIKAVVITPLLRFKDDVEVNLQSTSEGVLVNVRSQSRVGKGDFAANTRHILDLYQQLSAQLD